MNKIHLKFHLRTDRTTSDGLYPIYLYANINGERKHFSLNHAVTLKAWNVKNQEVSTTFINWSTINNDIARYRAKAEKIRISADDQNELVNMYEFEKIFRAGAKDLADIFSYITEDIKQFGNSYAPDTIKMYESQARKLKRFRDKLPFNEITPFFWKQYDSHLIKLNNNSNTRWKAFRTIKTFINKAIEDGILKTDPLRSVKVRKPEGNRLFLSQSEVKMLEKLYDGFLTKDLKTVLQYFLFSCYTGIRYSDIKNLKHSNIHFEKGNNYVSLRQHKTDKAVLIPIGVKGQKFLPLRGMPNQKVFNVYCNQATNRLLKDIMTLAKIDKSISFHCARHTLATIALELSHDIASVSKLLGHSKISTTQIYAKVLESSKRNVIGLMDAI
ncbi:MAG: site-specific integrase [Lentimicrobiaceae bacterium]|jgi:site-specific recombinase XerD